MIIYLAGSPGRIQNMPDWPKYRHVLFSNYSHQKGTMEKMFARKRKELKRESKQRKAPESA